MSKFSVSLLFTFVLSGTGVNGQTVNYFGFDPSYKHLPNDIIQAQNGDLLFFSSVNWAEPFIENFDHHRFLVRTDDNGNLIWENYIYHPWYGGGNLIEVSGGDFFVFGQNAGGNVCGSLGLSMPFMNYSVQMFSSLGDSVSNAVHSYLCEDNIMDFVSYYDMSYALVRSQDENFVNHRAVVEVSSDGNVSVTPIPAIQTFFGAFEKTSDGYLFARSETLLKTDLNGNMQWQQSMSLPLNVLDFRKVSNDSLLFLCRSQDYSFPDTLVKSDGLGNVDWQIALPARGKHILHHSSDVYVISGGQTVVAISPSGDVLWSRFTELNPPGSAIKTIELNDGRLATLAMSGGGWGESAQIALILDTLYATFPPCSANFELFEDAIPYHYIAVNMAAAYDSIEHYWWDWGDGQISYGPFPEHTYVQPATYNICLTITTESGCTDTYCEDLTFKSPVQLYHVNVVPPTVVGVGNGIAFPIEDMRLYPNPSDGQLVLSGRSSYDGNLRIEVINAIGQSVISSQIEVQRGDFAREFNFSLNPGFYQMIVHNDKGVRALPFSVVGR